MKTCEYPCQVPLYPTQHCMRGKWTQNSSTRVGDCHRPVKTKQNRPSVTHPSSQAASFKPLTPAKRSVSVNTCQGLEPSDADTNREKSLKSANMEGNQQYKRKRRSNPPVHHRLWHCQPNVSSSVVSHQPFFILWASLCGGVQLLPLPPAGNHLGHLWD